MLTPVLQDDRSLAPEAPVHADAELEPACGPAVDVVHLTSDEPRVTCPRCLALLALLTDNG